MARPVLAPDESLLTQQEVARKLRLSLRSVERARELGQLETVRVGENGGRIRITQRSVERYAASRLEALH